MNIGSDEQKPPLPTDADIEQEARQARKFSPTEAIARMAGPGSMKGASPVSPVQQAETAIGCWLRDNMSDAAGILPMLLHRDLRGSALLLENLDRPLVALAQHCKRLLGSDVLLAELVREADVEWARRMDERPRFEREGSPAEPGDPYTRASVAKALNDMLEHVAPVIR